MMQTLLWCRGDKDVADRILYSKNCTNTNKLLLKEVDRTSYHFEFYSVTEETLTFLLLLSLSVQMQRVVSPVPKTYCYLMKSLQLLGAWLLRHCNNCLWCRAGFSICECFWVTKAFIPQKLWIQFQLILLKGCLNLTEN